MQIELKKTTDASLSEVVLFIADNVRRLRGVSEEEQAFIADEIKAERLTVRFQQPGRIRIYHALTSRKAEPAALEKLRALGNSLQAEVNRIGKPAFQVVNESGNPAFSLAVAEGAILGNYQFLKYLKDKDKRKNSMQALRLVDPGVNPKMAGELRQVCEATLLARTLVNEPLSYLTAVQFSREMALAGKAYGFDVKVLHKKEIEQLGMGGLLGVNRGSIDPPTFTIMEYKPRGAKNKKPLVLVGKGVVFDTGGLSLKPTPGSMDEMKCDMSGAAAVVGTLSALAANKVPVHTIGLVPATDNRPGMNAYVPQDILHMMDGTTVEVLNTDAEGRLLLADALHYAKRFSPDLVIDLATLTGAAVRAVGAYASAMMGTAPQAVMNGLHEAGMSVYERTVQFPMWDEYGDEMKSDIADLKNLGGANAGQITAAKFLQHFTDYPWIHLDIAGPSWLNAPSAYRTKGGTGVGVRLLYHFITRHYGAITQTKRPARR